MAMLGIITGTIYIERQSEYKIAGNKLKVGLPREDILEGDIIPKMMEAQVKKDVPKGRPS